MRVKVRVIGLKALREERGLTQRKLAHDLGISQNYIHAIEAGARRAGPSSTSIWSRTSAVGSRSSSRWCWSIPRVIENRCCCNSRYHRRPGLISRNAGATRPVEDAPAAAPSRSASALN